MPAVIKINYPGQLEKVACEGMDVLKYNNGSDSFPIGNLLSILYSSTLADRYGAAIKVSKSDLLVAPAEAYLI